MSHTPGPWEVDDEQRICAHNEVIASADYLGRERTDEWIGNAKLIAAAPLMLAGLRLAYTRLTDKPAKEEIGALLYSIEAAA